MQIPRKKDPLTVSKRTLIHNMILGVSEGFEKKLEMVGVGCRTEKEGAIRSSYLGYSHPIGK